MTERSSQLVDGRHVTAPKRNLKVYALWMAATSNEHENAPLKCLEVINEWLQTTIKCQCQWLFVTRDYHAQHCELPLKE